MKVRAVKGNPKYVRTMVQPRYDDYRARRRATLGMHIPGVSLETMGTTMEERCLAYERIMSGYPRKSRGLIRNVARELLFAQQGRQNHRQHADELLVSIAERTGASPVPINVVYLSGIGRNACLLSAVRVHSGTVMVASDVLEPDAAFRLTYALCADDRGMAIIDPDFGFGHVEGPTPDVLSPASDCEHLAMRAMNQILQLEDVGRVNVEVKSNIL